MTEDSALTLVLDIPQGASPRRLDHCLLESLRESHRPALSRARLKELFKSGEILYRGRPADPSMTLTPGRHEIRLLRPDRLAEAEARASSRGAFLPVVYEDEELLVLNKASGVPSVPLDARESETAVGAALARDPGLVGVGRGGLEPGLLHRLDTGTSGLLVFARTQASYEHLQAQWKQPGAVRKIYRALAAPLPGGPSSHRPVRLLLGHDVGSSKRMRVQSDGTRASQIRGKPLETVTHITQLRFSATTGLADYEIEIETGVMHQIRCTLAHLGAPIVGDPIYGGTPSERLWLHAWRIRLPLPRGGVLWLESALPDPWP